MTQRMLPFSLALAALGLAACGGSDSGNQQYQQYQ